MMTPAEIREHYSPGEFDERMKNASKKTKKELLVLLSNADRLVWALVEELAKERERRKV